MIAFNIKENFELSRICWEFTGLLFIGDDFIYTSSFYEPTFRLKYFPRITLKNFNINNHKNFHYDNVHRAYNNTFSLVNNSIQSI